MNASGHPGDSPAYHPIVNRIRLVPAALAIAIASVAGAQSADSRPAPPYGATLTFGTGLVTIPVAWVSPATGDLVAAVSTRTVGQGSYQPRPTGSRWDLTQSLELHLGGRLALGASLYGIKNEQMGASAHLLLIKQPERGPRWLPSIAVGARNIGASKYQDRFVTGERRAVDILPGGADAGYGEINGNPSFYGVATREMFFGSAATSVTVGYGTGLFRENGDLGALYNTQGTVVDGLFFGGRATFRTSDRSHLAVVVENNGFDVNAGLKYTIGNIGVGAFLTEIEEEKGVPADGALANYMKAGLLFSYNASFPGIVRGTRQRAEAADARLELRRLEQEIAQRRVITSRLVAELTRLAREADASTRRDQEALIRQLNAEREALKEAQKRLENLQRRPPEKDGGR